jgi:hypothetical protein
MSSSLTITCPRDSRSLVWGFYCTKCGYLPLWREIENEVLVSVNGDRDSVADDQAKNQSDHELYSLKDLDSMSHKQAQKFLSELGETKPRDEIRDE